MSKIFLIAAAVLLLASAAFGFLNKGKMAIKQGMLTDAASAKTVAQAAATHALSEQKKAEAAAKDALAKTTDLETSVAAANKQVADLNTQMEDVKKSVTDKDTQIAQLNDKIKELGTGTTAANPAMAGLADQLKEAQTQRDELKAVNAGLESQFKSAQNQLATAEKQIQNRETMASMNGLRGQVLAVDRNWNFVVLNLGNRNGVVGNATMIVQRGSNLVGRIRITSVEPSQSIADIIPNSVPSGISVQPGDMVVFPGS